MNEFEKQLFVGRRATKLPYRLLRPVLEKSGETFPLVVFLHGKGESGTDNCRQLKWCVKDFAKPEVREKHPCFVAVPQCRIGGAWAGEWVKGKLKPGGSTDMADAVLGLIDKLQRELPIDGKRVLLGGLSMGGYGTWNLLAREPKRFAAAFPICGGGDPKDASKFTHVPIWAFHGADDEIVPVGESQRMIDALQASGAKHAKLTVYAGVGHHSWLNAFAEPGFFDWLFAQRQP
jgi:predicted peptidase